MPKPPRPKIMFLITSMAAGGAERIVVHLANWFCENGYDVDVLLLEKAGPYLPQIHDEVRVIELGRLNTAFGKLRRLLKQDKPNALISALPVPNLLAILVRLSLCARVKLIISEHTPISLAKSIAPRLRAKLRFFLMSALYRFADAHVCVSEHMTGDYAQQTGIARSRITCIYNPVLDEAALSGYQERAEHKWLADTENIPVILTAARFEPPRDFETVLHAFSLVLKERKARLIMLGEGSRKRAAEKLASALGISDHIDFPGYAANPYAYMARTKVFVHSSVFEGFGNVIVEALGGGAHVVATNCPGGPAEILESGKWGALVPIADEKAMAKAMLSALERPERNAEGRRRAMDFSVDKAARKYEALIYSLSAPRSGKL